MKQTFRRSFFTLLGFSLLTISAVNADSDDLGREGNPLSTGRGWSIGATTVSGNSWTISLLKQNTSTPSSGLPVELAFSSIQSNVSTPTIRLVTSATTITLPASATLGHVSNTTEYVYVYALDNGGTVELALSGSGGWDTNDVQSTTAISSSATDRYTLYSTTARTSKSIKYLGRLQSTQTTAGNWATGPSQADATPEVPQKLISASERYKVVSAFIQNNAPYVVSSQSGRWISSITKNAVGSISLTLVSGTFAATPVCTVSGAANPTVTAVWPTSATAIGVDIWTSSSGAATDADVRIICMGSY